MVNNPPASAGDVRDTGSIPGLGRSPETGNGKPSPVFLPAESYGQESSGSKGRRELGMTELT